MEETVLESAAMGAARFIASILGGIINGSITLLFLYTVGYIVLRYLVCGNKKDEFAEVSWQMRSGCKDMVKAFKNVMPGVVESAKFWSERKISEIKAFRDKRSI